MSQTPAIGSVQHANAEIQIKCKKINNSSTSSTPTPAISSPKPTQPNSSQSSNDQTMDINTFIAMMEVTMKFENHEITLEDNNINVHVWADGMAESALSAKAYGGSILEQWDQATDKLADLCAQYREYLIKYGLDEYHVQLDLLNEIDKERTLFSTLDGYILYDYPHSN